ncbi:hypothetical protein PIB30_065497 [Stylosanthes scabra]|uniref:ADP-ribosyl cyclase/cyclic ADP-ribose hydrolase n=1 Tax=Stylosanthes scabra TaxID=79078 RepID=A0ABU6ULI5_9FABA|nr:hypothetical protein [Stylosanthes scabra]
MSLQFGASASLPVSRSYSSLAFSKNPVESRFGSADRFSAGFPVQVRFSKLAGFQNTAFLRYSFSSFKPMASSVGEASSSSSMPRSYTYKVFLSFRGEDTYRGFTSHLYAALVNRGITTYIDRNYLQKGDVISKELPEAIEESMFAVVVLSPNYASSTWCLEELQKIVECNSNRDIVVVFYDVKPGDVRHQIGVFEEAFKEHEDKYGKESSRVTGWRKALKQIASYSNWVRQDLEMYLRGFWDFLSNRAYDE